MTQATIGALAYCSWNYFHNLIYYHYCRNEFVFTTFYNKCYKLFFQLVYHLSQTISQTYLAYQNFLFEQTIQNTILPHAIQFEDSSH
jgi:hypothetical protein